MQADGSTPLRHSEHRFVHEVPVRRPPPATRRKSGSVVHERSVCELRSRFVMLAN